MATLSQINTWWQTNIVPTVAQRLATFASFRNTADPIALTDVTGLSDALNAKANSSDIVGKVVLAAGTASYNVAAGTVIACIWFWGGTTDVSIGVGTSNSTNDLFDAGDCPIGGDLPFEGNKYFRNAQTIFFNGVASDTIVIIFKQ
jgi:hypothetical protein